MKSMLIIYIFFKFSSRLRKHTAAHLQIPAGECYVRNIARSYEKRYLKGSKGFSFIPSRLGHRNEAILHQDA